MSVSPEGSGERIVAVIPHTAFTTNYIVHAIVLTDKQLLSIPVKEASRLLQGMRVGTPVSQVVEAVFRIDPSQIGSLEALAGRGSWKKSAPGDVRPQSVDLPLVPELLDAAKERIPYEKIKEVKVTKTWGADEVCIAIKTGFLPNFWYVLLPENDIKVFLRNTPLGTKVKE